MKFFKILPIACLSLIPSTISQDSTKTQDFELSLPEGVEFCGNATEDVVTLEQVAVTPFPPVAGKSLSFFIAGNITHGSIMNGSNASLEISIGSIAKFATIPIAICDLVNQYNSSWSCPLKGPFAINYTVDLPANLPPIKFGVKLSGFNPSPGNERLTCINGTVNIQSAIDPNKEQELSLTGDT